MPVDRMIGLPLVVICRSSGRFVISPEGILNIGTPSASSVSALASSNGAEKKTIRRPAA